MADARLEAGRSGALEWAVCSSAYDGETRSGDAFLMEETQGGVLVGVVDGLGHGDEAADVAELALASLRRTAGRSLVASVTECHEALRSSRGAVMTLATVDGNGRGLTWLAVGNVDAAVVRGDSTGRGLQRWSLALRAGVVGDRLPPLQEATLELAPGDMLVAATDGLSPAFVDGIDPLRDARTVAASLHRGYATGDDDALVLVARCRAPG